jgi:excisionase family DNA binding protein
LAAGGAVGIVPINAELTTTQAAEILNVSRPFLIGLLDAGQIGYRKVGSHRRVRAESLMAYLRNDASVREAAADELAAETYELGMI